MTLRAAAYPVPPEPVDAVPVAPEAGTGATVSTRRATLDAAALEAAKR